MIILQYKVKAGDIFYMKAPRNNANLCILAVRLDIGYPH